MKILIVLGTRPEAIKLAPVIYALREAKADFKVCVSGQHRQMFDQVFSFFELKADIDLNLMQEEQGLNSLSSKILLKVDEVLQKEKPQLVIVQGDTTTAAMAAVASFQRQIKVAHVEAGLRTYNLRAPFPEEMNRQFIGRIASVHFAPTQQAANNLTKEGISRDQILVTGNTVIDALNEAKLKLIGKNEIQLASGESISGLDKFILVTGHRRENLGTGLANLCEALNEITQKYKLKIVFPVHMNPLVKKTVYDKLGANEEIFLIPPVEYKEMLWLLKHCQFVISDSGGIQEEAPSFGKKLLLTREHTERPEGIEAGWTIPVGTTVKKILEESEKVLEGKQSLIPSENPFGDGKASERIVNYLLTL